NWTGNQKSSNKGKCKGSHELGVNNLQRINRRINKYMVLGVKSWAIMSRVSSTVISTSSKSASRLGTTTITAFLSWPLQRKATQFILLYPREELLQCARLQHFSAAIVRYPNLILTNLVRNSGVNLARTPDHVLAHGHFVSPVWPVTRKWGNEVYFTGFG
ncbi:hypothetical protein F5887DRAFT_1044500, partial [Amanita rubescens]